jgi:hypothetical protein
LANCSAGLILLPSTALATLHGGLIARRSSETKPRRFVSQIVSQNIQSAGRCVSLASRHHEFNESGYSTRADTARRMLSGSANAERTHIKQMCIPELDRAAFFNSTNLDALQTFWMRSKY